MKINFSKWIGSYFLFGFCFLLEVREAAFAWQPVAGHLVKILTLPHIRLVDPWPIQNDPLMGQEFSIIAILQNGGDQDYRLSRLATDRDEYHFFRRREEREEEYIEKLLSIFQNQVLQEYDSRGRLTAANAVRAEGPFLDGRSALIAVTAYNDLSRIYAMMRVVNGAPLPLERRMQELLPEDERVRASLPPVELKEVMEDGKRVFTGARVELKNWFRIKGTDEMFSRLLFYFGENFGLFELSSPLHKVGSESFPVRATEFVLETDAPKLYHRILTRLGPDFRNQTDLFDELQKFPEHNTYWLRTDLSRFHRITNAMSYMLGRRDLGNAWLAREEIWQPAELKSPCAASLEQIPFFR
ncbi:MAG: hypothetical protein JWQ35_686 [Bacteriovoracaceae bacterium]|nr:hypothetical protein [Bacteriovoracaceae bacterium]